MRMMDAIVKPQSSSRIGTAPGSCPHPRPGEVLIKVHKTAICGTDVHIYDWNEWSAQHVKPPMVIGHEYVGEIAELGAGVTGTYRRSARFRRGAYITCRPLPQLPHGQHPVVQEHRQASAWTATARLPEYVCIGAQRCAHHRPSLDEDVVAMFDAVGNATHTALMFNLVGEDVLITGAGPCWHPRCRHRQICWRAPRGRHGSQRLPPGLALKMGADAAINSLGSRISRSP